MPVAATLDIQMQFSGSAGAWSSVGADVTTNPPVVCSYGIRGTGPADRMANTGTLTFALDNSVGNLGGKMGYYSPGNANARAGFELGIGVRAAITYSGSTFYKFIGSLEDISAVAGIYNARLTYCTVVDWMDEAAKERVSLLTTQVNQRGDQVIATVVAAMTRKPAASAFNAGDDVFPYALDNNRDFNFSPATVFANVCNSELGFLFLKGDQNTGGVLTFLDRHARPSSGSSLGTFNDTMVSMIPKRSRATIYNDIKTSVHPRRVDAAASILFTLGLAQAIPNTGCLTIQGQYTDPTGGNVNPAGISSACNLAASTDWLSNGINDNSGLDVTASTIVSASFGGTSFRVNISNNSTAFLDFWLTKLQVRGRGLYDYAPVVLESKDTNSSACFGNNVLPWDMPYQSDATGTGQNAADYLLQSWSQPMTRIESVNFTGNVSDALMKAGLAREPSDRVTLIETVTGISGDYFIQGIDWRMDGKNTFHFGWLVVPVDATAGWLIGVAGFSEIGQTTRVGY